MAGTTSNIAEVERHLLALADAVDLSGGLGADCLDAIAEGIADRTIGGQKGPDGEGLKELTAPYLRRKVAKGQPSLVTVATGETLSLVQLKGKRSITPGSAEMTYGDSPEAIAKAGFLTDQGRAFYALDATIAAAVRARLADHLARVVGP